MQPYGYIKNTQLVGWGECDNPFFAGDQSEQIFKPRQGAQREPFKNHAFISVGPKPSNYPSTSPSGDSAENQNVDDLRRTLDACAGPHTGSETRAEYEDKAIDKSEDALKMLEKDIKDGEWGSHRYWTVGVHNVNCANLSIHQIEGGYKENKTKIAKLSQTLDQFIKSRSVDDKQMVVMDIPSLLSKFEEAVREDLSNAFTQEKMQEGDIPPQLGFDGSTLERKYWVRKNDFESLTYLRLSVLKSFEQAVLSMKARVLLFTPSGSSEAFEKPTDESSLGHISFSTGVRGRNQVKLFVYHNILVEISSWQSPEKVRSYASLVSDYFESPTVLSQDSIDLPNCTIDVVDRVEPDERVPVKVKVCLQTCIIAPLHQAKSLTPARRRLELTWSPAWIPSIRITRRSRTGRAHPTSGNLNSSRFRPGRRP